MHCHARNIVPVPVAEVGEIDLSPIVEPITVEALRKYIHSAEEDDDALAGCISSSREKCEAFTGRTFAKRQLELRWAKLGRLLIVSNGPLSEIDEIGYVNTSGEEVTFADEEYLIEGQHAHSTAIRFRATFVEPNDIATDMSAPIFLRGTFGPDPETVGNLPSDIVQAIMWEAAFYAQNGDPEQIKTEAGVTRPVENLLSPHRHNPI